jgi:cytochrome c oxidase subunit 3
VQHENKNGVWYIGQGSLPSYTTQEVISGFIADDDLVIKTEKN